MQRTVIVVPCYNEAGRLPSAALLEALEKQPWLSLMLVDDGSKDGTPGLLEGMAQRYPERCFVVALPKNQGKAEAVRQGILTAEKMSPAYIGYFDADLATPLSELRPMIALFEEPLVHLVMGSRVQLLGRSVHRSHLRHYLGRVFASSASLILGLGVYDTQCGAKLFRNTPEVLSLFREPFSVNWSFDVEIIARLIALAKQGRLAPPEQSAVEYPLTQWRDVSGSKLGPGAALQAGVELVRIWRRYRPARPS